MGNRREYGVQIVTLVENDRGANRRLRSEHGIAVYVEFREKRILFDTGASSAIVENAERLRIDLKGLDALLLSHGHYDHSGGVRSLLEQGIPPPRWVGKGFFQEKYVKEGPAFEYVGNDFDPEFLEQERLPWQEVDTDVVEIVPGAFAVTRFHRTHADETENMRFWLRKDGEFRQDPFSDEILLVLDTARGLVVLLGCSHPGVKNMLDTVRERFSKRIHLVLGGTHLVDAPVSQLDSTIQYFAGGVSERWGLSHCTGEKALDRIRKEVKGAFPNHTGTTLWLDPYGTNTCPENKRPAVDSTTGLSD